MSSNVNVLPKNFGTCAFCQMDFADVYRCPKCKELFCSLKCYRSEKHISCSDDFYKTQIQQHMKLMEEEETDSDDEEPEPSSSSKKPEAEDEDKGRLTFEQYMEKHKKKDAKKTEDEVNPQLPINPDEELVIDPEDEPEYLQDILTKSVKDFEHMDEKELDKQLGELDIDFNDEEQLLKKLTPQELKAFRRLTDEMFDIPQKSCFK